MVAAAEKYGYKIQERANMSNGEHYVAGIQSTHDALKWVFDAEEGEISPLYECGNNDRLLVIMLNKINKKGYTPMNDKEVREYLNSLVVNDKKAEVLKEKAEGVTSIAAAREKGAKIDTVRQVTFNSPVFVQATGYNELTLSGAVAATEKGKFCQAPVVGDAGVYLFSVEDKKMVKTEEYNEVDYEQRLQNIYLQDAHNFMQQLYQNADITDNRYLFF